MASKKKKSTPKKGAAPAVAPTLDPAKCPHVKGDGFQCGGRPMANGKCKHHGGLNAEGQPAASPAAPVTNPLADLPTAPITNGATTPQAQVKPSASAGGAKKKKASGKKSSKPAAAVASPAATAPVTPTPGVDTVGPVGGNATLADHQASATTRKALGIHPGQAQAHIDSHMRLTSFQALGKAAGMVGDAALILQTFGRQCPGTFPQGTPSVPDTYTSLQDQAKDLAECAAEVKFELDNLIKHLFITT